MATSSEFEKLLESNISQLNMTPGEIIPATVIDIKNDFVITNAGLKSEGIIPKNQFMNSNGELEVSVGDVVVTSLSSTVFSSLIVVVDVSTISVDSFEELHNISRKANKIKPNFFITLY